MTKKTINDVIDELNAIRRDIDKLKTDHKNASQERKALFEKIKEYLSNGGGEWFKKLVGEVMDERIKPIIIEALKDIETQRQAEQFRQIKKTAIKWGIPIFLGLAGIQHADKIAPLISKLLGAG